MNRYSFAAIQAVAAVPAAILLIYVSLGLMTNLEAMPMMLKILAGVTWVMCAVMVFLPIGIAIHVIDVSSAAPAVKPKKAKKTKAAKAAAAPEAEELSGEEVEDADVEEAELTDDTLAVFDEAEAEYGDAEEEVGEMMEGLKGDDVPVVEGALTQQSLNAVQLDDADIIDDDDKTDELDIMDYDEEDESDKKK